MGGVGAVLWNKTCTRVGQVVSELESSSSGLERLCIGIILSQGCTGAPSGIGRCAFVCQKCSRPDEVPGAPLWDPGRGPPLPTSSDSSTPTTTSLPPPTTTSCGDASGGGGVHVGLSPAHELWGPSPIWAGEGCGVAEELLPPVEVGTHVQVPSGSGACPGCVGEGGG